MLISQISEMLIVLSASIMLILLGIAMLKTDKISDAGAGIAAIIIGILISAVILIVLVIF